MSLLQELLALRELAPEQPNKNELDNKQTVGHPGAKPGEEDNGPEQKDNQPPQHEQNAKEQLSKLFADADEANELMVYKRQDTYDIRQAKPEEQIHISWPGEITKTATAEPDQYVVRKPQEVGKMKLIDKEDFEDKYELVNPNEKPDAEGFASYTLTGEILAFQYHEKESLKLNISGHSIQIDPESYVGHPSDNAKKLIVMSKADFEKKYRLT